MLIPTWTTKDGERIPVTQMKRSHILNSIAKIERSNGGWRSEQLEGLKVELLVRSIEGRD